MRTPGTNWQLTLADLSIILFLTSFSALAQDRKATHATRTSPARHAVAATTTSVTIAEPVALWRADPGAPPLATWLKDQGADGRMRVNVVGVYGAGDRDSMLARATALSADPALSGRAIRLILEPATHSSLTVTLSYDQG